MHRPLVVLVVGLVVFAGTVGAAGMAAPTDGDGRTDLLTDLQRLVERVDSLLESVVDLLETFGRLFGEGGGGGD